MGCSMNIATSSRFDLLPKDSLGRLVLDSYARMSDGYEGKEINVASQFSVNDKLIRERGAVLGERFDDPLSAWKRRVKRPGWDQLIWRMQNRVSAGAVIYNIDRFLRQNRQLENLFDIVEGMGCVLLSPGSEWDLDNEDHRLQLRLLVSFANKSSADTARRVKAKLIGMREAGILPASGKRPFAWPGGVSDEQLEREREALRWAFDKSLEGTVTLTKIAQVWNEQGFRGWSGVPWTYTMVRQTMKRQRYAGRIEHKGEVVGNIADHKPTIDPLIFDQVQMSFAARRVGRPPSRYALGSGIVRCAVCDYTLSSRPKHIVRAGKKVVVPQYECRKQKGGCGSIAIPQAPVDEFLRQLTIKKLSDPTVAGKLNDYAFEADVRGLEMQAELEAARARQTLITEKFAVGEISDEAYLNALELISPRIRTLETQLAQVTAAAADLGAVAAKAKRTVETDWEKATLQARRKMVMSATRLFPVSIEPAVRHGRKSNPLDRIKVTAL